MILRAEFAQAYSPAACEWWDNTRPTAWNEQWGEDCKQRYMAVQPCWNRTEANGNSYNMENVVACLKVVMRLPMKLEPIDEYCVDDEVCRKLYKEAVHHLIVGRFYDAEERIEDELFRKGKLTLDQTVEALTWVTQHKKDFYSATTKAERLEVIDSFLDNWNALVKTVQ